jgi:superfamily I DNA/RNA helicase
MLLTKTGLQTASEYQINIFRHIEMAVDCYFQRKPVANAVVQAVAGSGKTTTIVASANLIPKSLKAVFLAFNKPVAVELGDRLPKHVEAKTLNSLGWGICKSYADGIAGHRISFDDFNDSDKVKRLIRKIATYEQRKDFYADIKFLVDQAKSLGIVPADLEGKVQIKGQTFIHESANGLRDTDDTWNKILTHFGKTIHPTCRPTVYELVRKVLVADLLEETCCDFDDQKYFPVVKRTEDGERLPCFKRDVVIIDEVQDVSPVDMGLVQLICKSIANGNDADAVVMGVGDSQQAIYAFRGADIDSVDKFKATFNAIELPLSISYRCARSIVKRAREVWPTIEAAADAPEGSVENLDSYNHDIFSARNGDMIICRNNAPIVDFAYKLIRRRVPVFVKGRDIGKGLLTLIDSLKATDVRNLSSNLMMWQEQQARIILDDNPDNEEAVQRIDDRAATLMVFIRENSDGKVDTVRDDIERLFDTNGREGGDKSAMKGKVVLSTIHKAKGLEADTVFFLDQGLLYGRWITPGTWMEIQEKNLEYVGVTRAKNRLVFIDSDGLKD